MVRRRGGVLGGGPSLTLWSFSPEVSSPSSFPLHLPRFPLCGTRLQGVGEEERKTKPCFTRGKGRLREGVARSLPLSPRGAGLPSRPHEWGGCCPGVCGVRFLADNERVPAPPVVDVLLLRGGGGRPSCWQGPRARAEQAPLVGSRGRAETCCSSACPPGGARAPAEPLCPSLPGHLSGFRSWWQLVWAKAKEVPRDSPLGPWCLGACGPGWLSLSSEMGQGSGIPSGVRCLVVRWVSRGLERPRGRLGPECPWLAWRPNPGRRRALRLASGVWGGGEASGGGGHVSSSRGVGAGGAARARGRALPLGRAPHPPPALAPRAASSSVGPPRPGDSLHPGHVGKAWEVLPYKLGPRLKGADGLRGGSLAPWPSPAGSLGSWSWRVFGRGECPGRRGESPVSRVACPSGRQGGEEEGNPPDPSPGPGPAQTWIPMSEAGKGLGAAVRASVRQTAPARPPSPSAAPWPRLQPPKTKTMAEASTDPRGGGRSPLRGYTEPLSPRGPLPHGREGTSFRHPRWKALPAWSSEVPRAWSWTADGGRRVLGLVAEPPLAQRRLDCLLGTLLSQTGLAGGGFWKAGLLRGGGRACVQAV